MAAGVEIAFGKDISGRSTMLNFNSPSQMFPPWMFAPLPALGNPDVAASAPPMPPTPALAPVDGPTAPTPAMSLPNLSAGAPTPPALPPLLERTDTQNLQSNTGDIHQRYQPLIDMALHTMMDRQGADGSGFHMSPLAAIGLGLSMGNSAGSIGAGRGPVGGTPGAQLGQMQDMADQADKARSDRAVAAGHLLNELASSEAANQEGLARNVGAFSDYREAQMKPRAHEFENLKNFEQGLAPLANATSKMETLPELKANIQSRTDATNARKDLTVLNTDTAKQMQPDKIAKGASQADAADSVATIKAAQAVNAQAMSDARLKYEQQKSDLSKLPKSYQSTPEYQTAMTLRHQIDAWNKEFTMLEREQSSPSLLATPDVAVAHQKRMDTLQSMISSGTDDLDKTINGMKSFRDNMQGKNLPSIKPRTTPTPTPFPTPAPIGADATPTPLPALAVETPTAPLDNGAQTSSTPGLDSTAPGKLVPAWKQYDY